MIYHFQFAGFILKLITITIFFIIYPLRNDTNAPKIVDTRKKSGLFGKSFSIFRIHLIITLIFNSATINLD